jgi:hypothetical protein
MRSTNEVEAAVEEKVAPDERVSSRGLIASVISDAQRLLTLEIALAKQETKELATRNAIALGVIAFGALLVILALLVAAPVAIIMLVPWKWEAAAVWVGAYLLIGLCLLLIGRARLRVSLPPRTVESLKENKEWALRRVRSNGR